MCKLLEQKEPPASKAKQGFGVDALVRRFAYISNNTLWMFNNRISFSIVYGKYWEKPIYSIHNNGGRKANECLDIDINIHRLAFSMVLWNIGKFAKILKYFPSKYA